MRSSFQFDRLSWIAIVVLVAVTFFYSVQLGAKSETASTRNLVYGDMSLYATALSQQYSQTALAGDLLYGNRAVTGDVHPVYIAVLQVLHDATGEDFDYTHRLYRAILFAVYTPGMFFFLFAIFKNWLLALALAVATSGVSSVSITGGLVVTGMIWSTGLPILPHMVYTAIVPWIGWLVLKFWFKPGWHEARFSVWHILLVGLITGLTSYIHSISAIAIIEILLGVALFQVLWRKLPLWTFFVFVVGVAPGLMARILEGVGFVAIPFESARFVIDLGAAGKMVYPWRGLQLEPEYIVVFLFALHIVTSLGLGLLAQRAKHKRRRQIAQALFITVQIIYANVILSISPYWSGIIIVVGVYAVYRAWTETYDELDVWLFAFLVIALLSGPFQQMITHTLWSWARLTPFTGLLYEMARFAHFAYLPLFALLGRAIWFLAGSVLSTRWWVMLCAVGALAWVLWWDRGTTSLALVVGIFGIAQLVALLRQRDPTVIKAQIAHLKQPQPLTLLVAGMALMVGAILWSGQIGSLANLNILLIGLGIGAIAAAPHPANWRGTLARVMVPTIVLLFLALPHIPQEPPSVPATEVATSTTPASPRPTPSHSSEALAAPERLASSRLTPEYLEMTAWVRENTSEESRFHLTTFDPSFRYYARRGIILGRGEERIGVYLGIDPLVLVEMGDHLEASRSDPESLVQAASELDAAYIVELTGSPALPLEVVFQNALYTVYVVENLP